MKRAGFALLACLMIAVANAQPADTTSLAWFRDAKFGLFQDEINGDEAMALKLANEGKSTKNLPNAENRGYGITSSKDMLVDGLKGSFFMLSGGAFHRSDSGGDIYINLPPDITWRGTVVLLRIPDRLPQNFDYTEYME